MSLNQPCFSSIIKLSELNKFTTNNINHAKDTNNQTIILGG